MSYRPEFVEFVKKWIVALRSGEYKQGKGVLAIQEGDTVAFCCLGVAGHLCGYTANDMYMKGYLYPDKFPAVPKELEHVFEDQFKADVPLWKILQGMNDHKMFTFDQIADYLEKEVVQCSDQS